MYTLERPYRAGEGLFIIWSDPIERATFYVSFGPTLSSGRGFVQHFERPYRAGEVFLAFGLTLSSGRGCVQHFERPYRAGEGFVHHFDRPCRAGEALFNKCVDPIERDSVYIALGKTLSSGRKLI